MTIEVIIDFRDIQSLVQRPSGVPVEEAVAYDIVMGALIRRKLSAAGIPVVGVLWAFTVFRGVLECKHTPEQLVYRWHDEPKKTKAVAAVADEL